MKTYLFNTLSIVLILIGVSTNINAQKKPDTILSQVFLNETDSINKFVLKLYDDQSYEFLKFIKIKKNLSVKREQGAYNFKGKKLYLEPKSDKLPFEHPYNYFYLENIGLFESKKCEGNAQLTLSNDERFSQAFYIDPVFGKISNDKKLANKLNDPKLNVKTNSNTAVPEITATTPTLKEEIIIEKFAKLSSDSLKRIKVVIVVGPVEESTKEFIDEKKELANFLRAYGVQVKEYYHPNANWADVKAESKGAHIFIYSGHGSTVGENGCSGGLCLTDGITSAGDMSNGLELNKNALILFNHVCRGAGSSASDDGDIGKIEAAKRVTDYSYPFIQKGAGCYYANNTNGALQPFLERFFNKMPVSSIWKEVSGSKKIVIDQKYKYDKRFQIALGADDDTGTTFTRTTTINGVKKVEKIKGSISYDAAIVGIPQFTVLKFFEK